MAKSALTQYCCSAARREAESVAAKSSAAPANTRGVQVEHSATPYTVESPSLNIRSADLMIVATVWRKNPDWSRNADFIVRACNAHQALYEALSATIRFNHHHDYCGAEDMTHPTPCVCGATTAVLQARTALALADAAQGEKNG